MRSTRATELADQFPSRVCAAWLGHTETVADEFYRQVTDEHFQRAKVGVASAAQNPAQSVHEMGRNRSQGKMADVRNMLELQGFAKIRGRMQNAVLGDTGFEPVTPSV